MKYMMLLNEFDLIEDALSWYTHQDEDTKDMVIRNAVSWFLGFRESVPDNAFLGVHDMAWFIRSEDKDEVFLETVLECMADSASGLEPTGYGCILVSDDREVE